MKKSKAKPCLIVATGPKAPKKIKGWVNHPDACLTPMQKAQLGTYYARMVASGHTVRVLTHSDELKHRILIEIRNRVISPNRVVFRHYEKRRKFYNVRFDGVGNVLTRVPRSYRAWELEECLRSLGVDRN